MPTIIPKILLVEDDNNLREIFEMRLKAEGYDTVTASDGEEALVTAMKEKPDLIIADVMMPKLSGFEMLETLRATPEMAATKTIMMTALGQAEDRARGERLGVIKYLVKSQVTLEDFVRVVREVMAPSSEAAPAPAVNSPESNQAQNNKESEAKVPEDTSTNPQAGDNASQGVNPMSGAPADAGGESAAQEQSEVQSQIDNFAASSNAGAADDTAAPAGSATTPGTDSAAPTGDSGTGTDTTGQPAVPPVTPPADPAPQPPADSGQAPTDQGGTI
ncbi:MAG TPA: response regulator [Candidatus Saccharimonadales bacterium]|nr:response regulator [Candidatus Saccharimonadales bacterium]